MELLANLQETQQIPAQLISRTSQLFKFQMRIAQICFLDIGLGPQPVTKMLERLSIFLPPPSHIHCHGLLKDLVTPCSSIK